ncbi:GNAT family N-acetyltransferase [Streptomyces sp. NPDC085659]|uniref:GNAT family N-acetyltransferase n=1 Tax=Streptomyces sp. NPDC085659 TaxID=3155177 RepID=UPI0034503FD9
MDASRLPAAFLGTDWEIGAVALAPGKVHARRSDPRWEQGYVLATVGDTPVGFLSTHRSRVPDLPDPDYALKAADEHLLLGGRHDLVAGAVVARGCERGQAAEIRRQLVRAGVEHAAAHGLRAAALYVRDDQAEAFRAGFPSSAEVRPVSRMSVLDIDFDTQEGYLARLSGRKRSVVRRDWRDREAAGLRTEEVPALDAIPAAAPLVTRLKRRYGIPDHERLAAFRLTEWASGTEAEFVAFLTRDAEGGLIAAGFGCRHGDTLEMYEVGLDDSSEHRRLGWAETLFYAPLRHALRRGCRRIQLGLESEQAKIMRGAEASDVWHLITTQENSAEAQQ